MKIDPKIQYKSETGETPFLEIETRLLAEPMDALYCQSITKNEIIDCIKYDHTAGWGVLVSCFPEEYKDECEDLKICTPDYIKWLESKREEV